ncbi:MAG: ABC transporter substrate-binding protein [Cyanobacteria bacterium J06635_13]
MAKKIWFLALILLASFFVTTNWHNISSISVADSTSQPERPLVIGYSNWAGWWPWAIAESKGFFAQHGANVELRWYDDYTKSLEDLAAGHIDGNCQTLNDTISFIADAVKGEVIVLVNDNSAGNDKIIATADIQSVRDLVGRRVAVEAGVVDDFLLTLALEQEGLSRNNVAIVDLETGAAVEAFVAGQADGVGAFPPFWLTALKRSGAKEIISSAAFPGAIPDLLVVTRELVEEHSETVAALIDTWFEVLDFMASQPNEADRIMAERAGVSESELQLFKAGTKMFTAEDNLAAFSEGKTMKSLFYAADKITDFLQQELKSIAQKPDLSQLFNPNFIKSYVLQRSQ